MKSNGSLEWVWLVVGFRRLRVMRYWWWEALRMVVEGLMVKRSGFWDRWARRRCS
jgi:hypothetical protein